MNPLRPSTPARRARCISGENGLGNPFYGLDACTVERTSKSVRTRHADCRGQTLIFLLMVMVILSFVMFSVYDTQHVIVQRVRSQNAVDAAALTGARWQLSSLNAIGEINLLKVTTMIVTQLPPGVPDEPAPFPLWRHVYSALDNLQRHIRDTGPLMGILYAQQAAKLNGIHAVDGFSQDFYTVASILDARGQTDRAALVRQIAATGVAAMPNIFPDTQTLDDVYVGLARYLKDPGFYGAIAASDWCWFFFNWPSFFGDYQDYTSWGPVDQPDINFHLLGLRLRWQSDDQLWAQNDPTGQIQIKLEDAVRQGVDQRGLEVNPNWPPPNGPPDTNYPHFNPNYTNGLYAPSYVPLRWMVYNNWGPWPADPPSGQGQKLLIGDIQPRFNYAGADSVWEVKASANVTMAVANPNQVSWTERSQQGGLREALNDLGRIKQQASNLTDDDSSGIVAKAAAKAFGSLPDNSTPPTGPSGSSYFPVLPVFKDVRLIPMAFSSGTSDFDPGWLEHLFFHVPRYTQMGLSALSSGCGYCQQLRTWELLAFRQQGNDWLSKNSDNCHRPTGGGGGGGGTGGIIAH